MSDISKKSAAQAIREWVQFLTIIFVAGFGVYQFVQKEILIPSRRPAVLIMDATLDPIGRRGNLVLLRARIHFVNKSTNRVYVSNLWYTATGVRFEVIDPPNRPEPPEVEKNLDGDAWFNAFSKEALREVVAVWKFPSDSMWFDATDETTEEQVFYVPASRYDAVQLKVQAYITRNIEDLAPGKWTVQEDGSFFPLLFLKKPGWEKDPSLVEEFDDAGPHKKWADDNNVGEKTAYATVSLSNPVPTK